MLEDYPANPMDSMQTESPDYEDELFEWKRHFARLDRPLRLGRSEAGKAGG
jgi:hypothetical protein